MHQAERWESGDFGRFTVEPDMLPTISDTVRVFQQTKKRKACGEDLIAPEVVALASLQLASQLHPVFLKAGLRLT